MNVKVLWHKMTKCVIPSDIKKPQPDTLKCIRGAHILIPVLILWLMGGSTSPTVFHVNEEHYSNETIKKNCNAGRWTEVKSLWS